MGDPDRATARGMTLVELIIVVAVMGILLATAVPSYQTYMLRVHRTEAIRMLLQVAMCQERIHARAGSYDTSRCQPASAQQGYQLSYGSANTQGQPYVAIATPNGAQMADACGSLSLDQNGNRIANGSKTNSVKCWNGR
jgi:type IV pilus assembly protein PilE